MNCAKLISSAIGGSCEYIHDGFEKTGVIINKADVDIAAVSIAENVIATLPLVSTKKGFKVTQPGNKPFNGAKTTLNVGDYFNTYTKEVQILIVGDNLADAEAHDKLMGGEFVLVLPGNGVSEGKKVYYVYGIEQGMKVSAAERVFYDDNTKGGWLVTLTETKAQNSEIYLDAGTDAATKTLFDGLTA